MTHGSLFSGIGGFDLAAQDMGWQNIFHCEINDFCQKILKYYWPNADSYTDIKQTDFSIYRGKIDVLSGGFPCQPFSMAGSRKGTEDDRYLWPEMLRAIDEIRPAWVIGENVAGLVSMVQPEIIETDLESQTNLQGEVDRKIIQEQQQYVIETVCSDLEGIGYSVQPIIIPACAVGAPHRRDRVWFIAHRTDAGIEGMRESQKYVHGPESFTDTTSDRRNGQRTRSEIEDGEQESECSGIMEGRSERLCFQGNAADTGNKRLQRECVSGGDNSFGREKPNRRIKQHTCNDRGTLPAETWKDFPTQPPVCSGNDGISDRLDGITFPKWRVESIKALGNAVVPQVVFEIFKAIEEAS